MDVFDAAERGDLERVRAAVEHDAELVHATDYTGRILLNCAAHGGHVEVARYLLDRGAAVNDPGQASALHWACFAGHPVIVSLLLQRGADVTAVDFDNVTPLMEAASEGRDAVARMLLEHGGSDVDAAAPDQWTACHWACYRGQGHAGVLRLLLEAGADPTLRDVDGHTALDLARQQGHHECVTILQEWERAYLLQRVRRVRDARSTSFSSAAQHL